jgi:hypothetical protein
VLETLRSRLSPPMSTPRSTPLSSNRRVIAPIAAPASQPGQVESAASTEREPMQRELPDVTGFLVLVLVTVGLFIVPVGATIMQGPAIVASLFAGP